ncbi:MAG: O-acetylserine/cysteine exporter [Micavibrio aeruginosavorus]|uniref:O-acetylserine/cysteine exporter n=1 Tax=Micavibrio aeruginosavorus TaxID=349221 RepID=A0A2W5PTJ8_9BACT|nr:MAG: O-acetylserine/cysteine exporter [Micavibrio aeruginosavorus]
MHRKDIFLVLLVTVLWGLSFTVIKIGVADMPPLFLCAMRFLFTAIPAAFFIKKPQTSWAILASFGLCLGVAVFGLLFVGIKQGMGAGLSSVIMQAQVFFTILLSSFIFKEHLQKHQWAACLLCFAGLGVLAMEQSQPSALVPFLIVMAASFCWGCANIITKKAGNIDMVGFIVYSSLFSPIPLIGLSFVLDGPEAILHGIEAMTWTSVLAIGYLAFLATLLAFSLWSHLLQKYKAPVVTPFALLVPVSGMLCAMIFLGERITMMEMAGGALIFTGLIINIMGSRLRTLIGKGS